MLGVIVCYSLSTNLNVSGGKLYEKARQYNVPLFLLPEIKSPASSFRTAMEQFALKNSSLVSDIKVEQPLISKRIYTRKGGGFSRVADVVFNKCSEEITFTPFEGYKGNASEYESKIREEYSLCLRRIMVDEIRCSFDSAITYYGGIKIRPSRGTAFIPEENYSAWVNFEKAFTQDGVSFLDITVENTESNRRSIWIAFNNWADRNIENELVRVKRQPKTFCTLEEKMGIIADVINNKKLTLSKAKNLYQRIEYLKSSAVKYNSRLQRSIPVISVCDSISSILKEKYGREVTEY